LIENRHWELFTVYPQLAESGDKLASRYRRNICRPGPAVGFLSNLYCGHQRNPLFLRFGVFTLDMLEVVKHF
jgi:hypothetical protein